MIIYYKYEDDVKRTRKYKNKSKIFARHMIGLDVDVC